MIEGQIQQFPSQALISFKSNAALTVCFFPFSDSPLSTDVLATGLVLITPRLSYSDSPALTKKYLQITPTIHHHTNSQLSIRVRRTKNSQAFKNYRLVRRKGGIWKSPRAWDPGNGKRLNGVNKIEIEVNRWRRVMGFKWNWEGEVINGGSEKFHGGRLVLQAKMAFDIVVNWLEM